ncbi:MAG: ferredoxin--NADP reductase [Burkholderiales bacterium]|nr:ferredoxin--NADP reductase [Burkholderiales bacterium]
MIPPKAVQIRLLQKQVWREGLVSLRFTKPESFTFRPGQFVRLGLELKASEDSYISRPYSFASLPTDPFLEFFVVEVPGGQFSPSLVARLAGEEVYLEPDLWGQLLPDRLSGGTTLWCLSTGTGLAPFISILRDENTWKKWPKIVLVNSVREVEDLCYSHQIEEFAQNSKYGGAQGRYFRYIPVVTRSPTQFLSRRIPLLLEEGSIQDEAGLQLDPVDSRVLICGNPEMVKATRKLLKEKGFSTPRQDKSGNMLAENLWLPNK